MMKKVLAILLALAMVFSFAACGQNQGGQEQGGQKQEEQKKEEKLVVKKGVTIPSFTVKVNGVPITNDDMADYDVYEASVTSTNTSGTTSTVVYIGFKVTDMIKAAGLTGTAGKLTATADDGYSVEWDDATSENNLIAISKDGTQFKAAPWFIPVDSETTGNQLKGCTKLDIAGMTAPADRVSDEDKKKDEATSELADPVKEDKTEKVKFNDFCFKVDGKEVKNADLEGLKIYKVAVQVVNKKGEVQDHTYTGYVLKDVLDKLGVDAGSVEVVANDGYTTEFGGAMVKNEYTIVAIECDKATGEDGTIWLAACSSHESNSYAKLVVEIKSK